MHRMLERQIKRAFGLDAEAWAACALQLAALAEAGSETTQPELEPAWANILSGLPVLLGRVADTYAQQERDLALIRRSLELSSDELSSANQKFRDEAHASAQALLALQSAFDAMRKESGQGGESQSVDLVILAEQVSSLTRDRERIRNALAKSEERFDLAGLPPRGHCGVGEPLVEEEQALADVVPDGGAHAAEVQLRELDEEVLQLRRLRRIRQGAVVHGLGPPHLVYPDDERPEVRGLCPRAQVQHDEPDGHQRERVPVRVTGMRQQFGDGQG